MCQYPSTTILATSVSGSLFNFSLFYILRGLCLLPCGQRFLLVVWVALIITPTSSPPIKGVTYIKYMPEEGQFIFGLFTKFSLSLLFSLKK